MSTFLALFTYLSYGFIIGAYTVKIIKYLKLPLHLRWELYPVIHEERFQNGGSCYEIVEWWKYPSKKRPLKGFFCLLKGYFTLNDYFKKNIFYWTGLFPWHMGFILIITFHILCFIGAICAAHGVEVSLRSPFLTGRTIFYLTLITGVVSFITGTAGSIIVFLNRWIDKDLKKYATWMNYFTYIFTFFVFLTGIYSWYFDLYFTEYRKFWMGLIQFNFVSVETPTMVHIIIFNLFLIYLPFTRSLHYITRFFAFYLIRWDDTPNIKGSEMEKRIAAQLNYTLDWSAPHISKGKTWIEQL
ncbi:MAG: respiratory nitrate reductase subunit gamma [Syntrophorhabdaceae bacterium]|nr:respiratory nitrate reductase subunit gamma [Syntrophorhabdaceae bacterium]